MNSNLKIRPRMNLSIEESRLIDSDKRLIEAFNNWRFRQFDFLYVSNWGNLGN